MEEVVRMIERTGDLFTTEAKHLGHGVNVYGKMGAGIAKTFRDKFPKMYFEYRRQCNEGFVPGRAQMVEENGMFIHNIASQDKPGPHASYYWLYLGLHQAMLNVASVGGDLLAIPEIGCGIGGLEWEKAKDVLIYTEEQIPGVTLEVWHYA